MWVDATEGRPETTTRTAECPRICPSVVQFRTDRTEGSRAMRKANLTGGRWGRDICSGGEPWHPLARHLVARFTGTTGTDEGMVRAAVAAIHDLERRLGSRHRGFSSLVVPLV